MSKTEDPRAVYDRAIERHRAHYAKLRQVAATLVYLRTKLAAEHPERRREIAGIREEAERAKQAMIDAGRDLRTLERERLQAIAALSTVRAVMARDEIAELADARDEIDRIAGEIEVERALR